MFLVESGVKPPAGFPGANDHWHNHDKLCIDADANPSSGLSLLRETTRFILPGNVLGLPCVSVPLSGPSALPDSVSIYADLWREDLCLAAAGVIEAAVGQRAPVEPVAPAR